MRRHSVLVLLLASLAPTACGRGEDRSEVRNAARTFLAAYARGDGAAACAQLATPTVTALEDQEQQPCARAITDLEIANGAIEQIEVVATSAKVDLHSGQSLFASQVDGEWRLSAVGCTPDHKPADHPFNCELEA